MEGQVLNLLAPKTLFYKQIRPISRGSHTYSAASLCMICGMRVRAVKNLKIIIKQQNITARPARHRTFHVLADPYASRSETRFKTPGQN